MHEMRKSDAVHQHPHRHVEGRKDVYSVQKLNKDHKSSMGTSSGRTDHRSKSHGVTQIPGAIRVCGDWSEQLSSNGKLYFFNIKTKSSQWERPRDWSNSRAIEVKKSKAQHNRVSSKHSTDSSSHHAPSRQHKTGHPHTDVKKQPAHSQPQQARLRTNHDTQVTRDRDYRTGTNSSAKDRDYRDVDYRDSRSSDSRNSIDASRTQQSHDRDYRSSGSSHDNRQSLSRQSSESGRGFSVKDHNGKSISLPNNTHGTLLRSDTHNDGDIYKDERSRSSSSTPRSSQEKAKTTDHESNSSVANGSDGTSALVQTLSSVLSQANQSSEDVPDSNSLEGNLKNALQMLLTVAAQNQQISGPGATEDAPQNEQQEEPPAKRPCLSHPVDEHVNHSLTVCQSAGKALEDLKSVFEEKYVSHVQGWQADQMERQSVRLCDENHQFVVNHTSHLSTAMKISRSRVRTSEIHSTLQEQRILYLRQQVTDLEKSTASAPFT